MGTLEVADRRADDRSSAPTGRTTPTPDRPDLLAPVEAGHRPAPVDRRALVSLQHAAGNRAVATFLRPQRAARPSPRSSGSTVAVQRQDPPSATEDAAEAPEPVYVFGYNGQTYAMDRAEFDDFKVTLLDTLRRDTGEPLRNKYLLLVDNWHSIRILNEHHRVVSYICEMLGAVILRIASALMGGLGNAIQAPSAIFED